MTVLHLRLGLPAEPLAVLFGSSRSGAPYATVPRTRHSGGRGAMNQGPKAWYSARTFYRWLPWENRPHEERRRRSPGGRSCPGRGRGGDRAGVDERLRRADAPAGLLLESGGVTSSVLRPARSGRPSPRPVPGARGGARSGGTRAARRRAGPAPSTDCCRRGGCRGSSTRSTGPLRNVDAGGRHPVRGLSPAARRALPGGEQPELRAGSPAPPAAHRNRGPARLRNAWSRRGERTHPG